MSAEYHLVMVSNTLFITGGTIRSWMKTLGWDAYFERFIFSDEARVSKPDPGIFPTGDHDIIAHIGDNPPIRMGSGAEGLGIPFVGINGQYGRDLRDGYRHVRDHLGNG